MAKKTPKKAPKRGGKVTGFTVGGKGGVRAVGTISGAGKKGKMKIRPVKRGAKGKGGTAGAMGDR